MHLGALMLPCAAFMPRCQRCSGRRVEARRGLEVGGVHSCWLDMYRIREVAVFMDQICTLSPRLRASLPKGNGSDVCRAGVADVGCIEGTRHQVGSLGEKSGKALPCPCNPAAVST